MRFTVTHPFHPLSGQVLVLVDRRHNAHEERVFYEDADSRLTSLPTRWTSLSAPDPFYVLPILMGATQFWQTKLTPTTADPAQQKIMMFMPLMFAAMSFSFPSGLVLYWLGSTLFTIAQQYFTNYLVGAPVKPAAK